jgi:hypothetical protein
MFPLDTPNVPTEYAPAVLAQTGQAQQPPKRGFDRAIEVCQLVENPPSDPDMPEKIFATNQIVPNGDAANYFANLESKKVGDASAHVTVLNTPTHGKLEAVPRGAGVYYIPETDYIGPDNATFQVMIGGMKVKVVYSIQVEHVVADPNTDPLCPQRYRKISGNLPSSSDIHAPNLAHELRWKGRGYLSLTDHPNGFRPDTRLKGPESGAGLRRGVFTSASELVKAIDEYVAHHNKEPKPFIWTKSARDILQKVIRANSRLSSKQNATLHATDGPTKRGGGLSEGAAAGLSALRGSPAPRRSSPRALLPSASGRRSARRLPARSSPRCA